MDEERPSPTEREKILQQWALRYPEAWEDYPWGDYAFKVRKKIFLMLSLGAETLRVTMKLPVSALDAVDKGATPTGYGLGKHGWVTITVPPEDELDEDWLFECIDESYRAVAPKRVVKALPGFGPA